MPVERHGSKTCEYFVVDFYLHVASRVEPLSKNAEVTGPRDSGGRKGIIYQKKIWSSSAQYQLDLSSHLLNLLRNAPVGSRVSRSCASYGFGWIVGKKEYLLF